MGSDINPGNDSLGAGGDNIQVAQGSDFDSTQHQGTLKFTLGDQALYNTYFGEEAHTALDSTLTDASRPNYKGDHAADQILAVLDNASTLGGERALNFVLKQFQDQLKSAGVELNLNREINFSDGSFKNSLSLTRNGKPWGKSSPPL